MTLRKGFDLYEYTGILVPGYLLLVGIALLHPEAKSFLLSVNFTVGHFGLSVLLAYSAGHLLQALGNMIEYLWWELYGGMPTDWVRTGKHFLLAPDQIVMLKNKMSAILGLSVKNELQEYSKEEWSSIIRQVYAAIDGDNRSKRVDIFNGQYGLNRGIGASFLFLLVVTLLYYGLSSWSIQIWLCAGFVVSIYRMHRFGRNYGHSLFMSFIIE